MTLKDGEVGKSTSFSNQNMRILTRVVPVSLTDASKANLLSQNHLSYRIRFAHDRAIVYSLHPSSGFKTC